MMFRAAIIRQWSLGTLIWVMLLGTPAQSAPEVTSNGFAVKFDVSVNAPAGKVYEALVGQVGSWWNPEHTYSHDAKNLSIDARPGGCFCEKLPNGGGIEHLRVVYVAPPQVVRFSGALGPLQASGVAGSMTWKLTGDGDHTRVQLSYIVGGFIVGGFDKIAPAVESMLNEQLNRLKQFAETGKPTATQ
jgi:uncharacterized protein YndB with AHSA1/START domain